MPAASAHTAFRGLYDEHHAFVWAVLRRLGVPEADAEDLMQEVFMVVHRRIDAFEGRSAWSTWLYGIATRVYWNYARRQRSRPRASASVSSLRLVDPAGDPERFAAQSEASELLEQLLGSLDADKRTAYVLHAIEGLSAPQISAITGVKTRTIYSRLRAAKVEIEASAERVRARARNDAAVRRLALASTAQPPGGMRRRAWVALMAQIPGLSGGAAAAVSMFAPWVGGAVATAAIVLVLSGATGTQAPARPNAASPVALEDAQADPPADPPTGPKAKPVAVDAGGSVGVAAAVSNAPRGSSSAPPEPSPEAPDASERAPDGEAVAELGPLHRARMRLRAGQAENALALLRAHALSEPNSPLKHEREKSMLVALCQLGRDAEADALAGRAGLALPPGCRLSR